MNEIVQKKNGLAIASMTLGIVAVMGSWIPIINILSIIIAVVGLALGIAPLISYIKHKNVTLGILLAGLILCSLTLFISITFNNAFNDLSTPDYDIDKMVTNHFYEKYNDNCYITDSYGSYYANNGVSQKLVSCNSVEGDILVDIDTKNEPHTLTDNYLNHKYQSQFIEYIEELALNYFEDAYIRYIPAYITESDELDANITFEDFISNDEVVFNTSIIIKETKIDEEEISDFADELYNNKVKLLTGFLILENELFDNIENEDYGRLISQGDYKYYSVINIKDDEIIINKR